MPAARLILCEKSTRWAAAVRAAADPALTLIETRALGQAATALAEQPGSLVACEVQLAQLEAALAFLDQAARRDPRARFVGLLMPEAEAWAPLLREAGACDVLTFTGEVGRLVRLAQRQPLLPTPEPEDPRAAIVDRLPWAAYASRREKPE